MLHIIYTKNFINPLSISINIISNHIQSDKKIEYGSSKKVYKQSVFTIYMSLILSKQLHR